MNYSQVIPIFLNIHLIFKGVMPQWQRLGQLALPLQSCEGTRVVCWTIWTDTRAMQPAQGSVQRKAVLPGCPGGAPKASLLTPALWWPNRGQLLIKCLFFLLSTEVHIQGPLQSPTSPGTLGSAVKGLFFGMWHLCHDPHLWLPPTLKFRS